MAGLIPLTDASRRPVHVPIVTGCIILTNFLAFALELRGGDAFVLKWAAVPAHIIAGHDWITILTAMFMHGSWSHILGNMVFLWAFGPEIEDSMNPLRYLTFYVGGGVVAMLAQIAVSPAQHIRAGFEFTARLRRQFFREPSLALLPARKKQAPAKRWSAQ